MRLKKKSWKDRNRAVVGSGKAGYLGKLPKKKKKKKRKEG